MLCRLKPNDPIIYFGYGLLQSCINAGRALLSLQGAHGRY